MTHGFTGWKSPVREQNAMTVSGSGALFSNSPERAYSEPAKGHRTTHRNCDATNSHLTGMIFAVLPETSAGEAKGHHEENDSGQLQP